MKRKEFRLFASPTVKTISWVVQNASSFELTVDGRNRQTALTGSIQVSGFGSHTITYNAQFPPDTPRGGVVITSDGVNVVSENNGYSARERVSIPCKEYSISSARDSCRSGYNKVNKQEWRYKQRSRSYKTGYPDSISYSYGAWTYPKPELPRSYDRKPVGKGPGLEVSYSWETRDNYVCQPSGNCQDSEMRDVTKYKTRLNGSFSITNERTEEEKEAEARRIAREQEEERLRLETEQREREEAESRRQIYEQEIERQRRVAKERAEAGPSIPEITESQDTRYRIISPLVYETINGKQVPQMRYESVRLLSPEMVSSYVVRGYEVEIVDPDTPLSYSKPYGPSVVERAKSSKSAEMVKGRTIPPGRVSIEEMRRLTQPRSKVGYPAIVKRNENRRIVE